MENNVSGKIFTHKLQSKALCDIGVHTIQDSIFVLVILHINVARAISWLKSKFEAIFCEYW